ncbi:heterokaryon incompatibility protein-domain-containing protein [Pyrenochaeta sp. MPI-SDFR-AT-0127]|nr:heterokaryon incompatibility protein-domain-containing protein [Pyrenochaeta sp. MPI-SDFR-AT-0127]
MSRKVSSDLNVFLPDSIYLLMMETDSACVAERKPPYQYTPLSGSRCIRILILNSARKLDNPIQCSFQETTLGNDDDPQDYIAVSYTWGASQGSRPILCEDRTILVTPNCEQALLHLRHKSKPQRLWIDAICIAQDSVQEKNKQVAIMGDIYHHASHTILWLGNGNPELSKTLRRAARYGSLYNRGYDTAKKIYRGVREDEPHYESYWQAPILSVAESQRIADLCSNEWFRRMWTLQEFWLSKSTTFMMGSITCSSAALFTYYSLGKKLVLRPDLEHFRLRDSMRSRTASGGEKQFLSALVQLAAVNKTTDARDKVYGMIAYVETRCPCVDLNVIDYTKSISEVYETFTRSLIVTTSSLWPLEFVTGHRSSTSDILPSWAVDLRDPEHLAPAWSSYRRSMLKSSTFQPPSTTNKPGQLRVLAKQVGEICDVSSRMPHWSTESEKTSPEAMDLARNMCLSEWTAFAIELDMHRDIGDPDVHLRALQKFTWELDYLRNRHKLEDEVSIHRYRHRKPEKAAKARKKELEATRKRAEKIPSFWDQETRIHDMCRLFLTSTGHLGESPGDVRVGDCIFILQGSTCPFIVRRKGRRFHLVGKAYVHNMRDMTGWDPTELDQDEDAKVIVLE